ncbi:MAG: hypothetical protein K2X93_15685 [Candidatus Obscuribacterales bacterium]|nr:hypothetical protein [Candidatus Obscuribacterales bacterium]
MRIEEYLLEDGSSPYKKWFDSLDPQAAAKVTVAKLRMERGLVSAIKWFEGVGEYRIDWGPGYRIYLAQDGDDLIILFGGGVKKRQNNDIEEAKRLHQEYKSRKAKLQAEKELSAKKQQQTKKKRS